MSTKTNKTKCKKKLRNNEYYNMQDVYDKLYRQTKEGKTQNKLLEIITPKENILLAYRNIKSNTGSNTKGTDGKTIKHLSKKSDEQLVNLVRHKLRDYNPGKVRRVEIPKPNGKTRPLGIPTIDDRLIQQCILQVLEPIYEAKFHPHSYGFRPNKATEHVIARSQSLINKGNNYYVVDIDIKGFFDNVDHGKLKRQMWQIEARDKRLLGIIGKMLKAEVEGIGIPEKGTSQGGILSPLLANIVLNELDWWIDSQWAGMKTRYQYSKIDNKQRALKKTKLKEMFIVRYADDFKIFCKNSKDAQKIFIAVKKWLHERLNLEISPNKSQVTNLKKRNSEFLGFRLKATYNRKLNKFTCQSHVTQKAMIVIQDKIHNCIENIQKSPTVETVRKYNATILGLQNYYSIASQVNIDFSGINYNILKTLYNRLKSSYKIKSPEDKNSKTYEKYYGDYKTNIKTIQGIAMFPIHGIKTRNPMCFAQEKCSYTEQGRALLHKDLQDIDTSMLISMLNKTTDDPKSVEYTDNRMSLYVARKGKCAITRTKLELDNMHCHHKVPKCKGGKDEYINLMNINKDVHALIHATEQDTINKYIEKIQILDDVMMKKINKFRKLVGNTKIEANLKAR